MQLLYMLVGVLCLTPAHALRKRRVFSKRLGEATTVSSHNLIDVESIFTYKCHAHRHRLSKPYTTPKDYHTHWHVVLTNGLFGQCSVCVDKQVDARFNIVSLFAIQS